MGYRDIKQQLRGVPFTTATPFSEDGSKIQHSKLHENLQSLERAGAQVFIPCGNTGEYYSLSHQERIEVVGTHVEATQDESAVVAGVGGSTKTAVELLSEYERIGADAAMVMYPRHTYIHEQGLVDYYTKLAESTDLGLVLYKRGPLLSQKLIDELSTINNVIAVKYAVNNIKDFTQSVSDTTGDLVWLNGIAERYAPAFALEGAEGYTTGIGNFAPEPVLALSNAIRNEDWARARHIRDILRPYEDLREESGMNNPFTAANNVPAVKYGMELAGFHGGPVRSPLVQLSEKDKKRTREYYEKINSATF
ncbi:dihydrodipicolinate synthase family protein [Halocatena marina]|uniref:Dihydrodipicolinate synthase family protein n=1 Tax=Halocatena marina TaxID=2934937 RepID=A0ABD5YWV5_9EURY|nr:dihydrodipicolinate synthase family protein [Halocatena marina]